MSNDDITIELARFFREAEAAVVARLAARNEGQAWIGLELEEANND